MVQGYAAELDPASPAGARRNDGRPTPEWSVTLVGGFEVRADNRVTELPLSGQRLVAFLAIHEQLLQRHFVAGVLWPEVSDERALASLRSVLWRLRDMAPGIVRSRDASIGLDRQIEVDVATLRRASRESLDRNVSELGQLALAFERDLLPDWYDDWLIEWRELWRQVRLHALERLARSLMNELAYELAIDAALSAIRAEPLRESAHRTLIEIHLAEGNVSEAIRQYNHFSSLLKEELDIAPSSRMALLIEGVTGR